MHSPGNRSKALHPIELCLLIYTFYPPSLGYLPQIHPVALHDNHQQQQQPRLESATTQETAMMDSRTGLDYIVENKDYVAKLGTALDSDNQTVKKQVFDLLSALCAYSPEGYNRAFETLEHYMVRRYSSSWCPHNTNSIHKITCTATHVLTYL